MVAYMRSDPKIHYRAVELLAGWLSRQPSVRPFLQKVSTNDTEKRIRAELAKRAL